MFAVALQSIVVLQANIDFAMSQLIIPGSGVNASSSAKTFYSLVGNFITKNQAQFLGLYTKEFEDYNDKPEYINTLLKPYLSAVKSGNYDTAEEKLILLSGATIGGVELGFIQDALEYADNPWSSSEKFYVYKSSDGTGAMAIIDRLVEEFKTLSGKLVPADDVNQKLDDIEKLAIENINREESNTISNLTDFEETVEKNMHKVNGLSFLGDSGKSMDLKVLKSDFSKGVINLKNIADKGISDIKQISSKADSTLLVTNNNRANDVSFYKSKVDDAAESASNNIKQKLLFIIADLTSLEKELINDINSIEFSTPAVDKPDSGGGDADSPEKEKGDDVAHEVEKNEAEDRANDNDEPKIGEGSGVSDVQKQTMRELGLSSEEQNAIVTSTNFNDMDDEELVARYKYLKSAIDTLDDQVAVENNAAEVELAEGAKEALSSTASEMSDRNIPIEV